MQNLDVKYSDIIVNDFNIFEILNQHISENNIATLQYLLKICIVLITLYIISSRLAGKSKIDINRIPTKKMYILILCFLVGFPILYNSIYYDFSINSNIIPRIDPNLSSYSTGLSFNDSINDLSITEEDIIISTQEEYSERGPFEDDEYFKLDPNDNKYVKESDKPIWGITQGLRVTILLFGFFIFVNLFKYLSESDEKNNSELATNAIYVVIFFGLLLFIIDSIFMNVKTKIRLSFINKCNLLYIMYRQKKIDNIDDKSIETDYIYDLIKPLENSATINNIGRRIHDKLTETYNSDEQIAILHKLQFEIDNIYTQVEKKSIINSQKDIVDLVEQSKEILKKDNNKYTSEIIYTNELKEIFKTFWFDYHTYTKDHILTNMKNGDNSVISQLYNDDNTIKNGINKGNNSNLDIANITNRNIYKLVYLKNNINLFKNKIKHLNLYILSNIVSNGDKIRFYDFADTSTISSQSKAYRKYIENLKEYSETYNDKMDTYKQIENKDDYYKELYELEDILFNIENSYDLIYNFIKGYNDENENTEDDVKKYVNNFITNNNISNITNINEILIYLYTNLDNNLKSNVLEYITIKKELNVSNKLVIISLREYINLDLINYDKLSRNIIKNGLNPERSDISDIGNQFGNQLEEEIVNILNKLDVLVKIYKDNSAEIGNIISDRDADEFFIKNKKEISDKYGSIFDSETDQNKIIYFKEAIIKEINLFRNELVNNNLNDDTIDLLKANKFKNFKFSKYVNEYYIHNIGNVLDAFLTNIENMELVTKEQKYRIFLENINIYESKGDNLNKERILKNYKKYMEFTFIEIKKHSNFNCNNKLVLNVEINDSMSYINNDVFANVLKEKNLKFAYDELCKFEKLEQNLILKYSPLVSYEIENKKQSNKLMIDILQIFIIFCVLLMVVYFVIIVKDGYLENTNINEVTYVARETLLSGYRLLSEIINFVGNVMSLKDKNMLYVIIFGTIIISVIVKLIGVLTTKSAKTLFNWGMVVFIFIWIILYWMYSLMCNYDIKGSIWVLILSTIGLIFLFVQQIYHEENKNRIGYEDCKDEGTNSSGPSINFRNNLMWVGVICYVIAFLIFLGIITYHKNK